MSDFQSGIYIKPQGDSVNTLEQSGPLTGMAEMCANVTKAIKR
jgi:hypothetical protein